MFSCSLLKESQPLSFSEEVPVVSPEVNMVKQEPDESHTLPKEGLSDGSLGRDHLAGLSVAPSLTSQDPNSTKLAAVGVSDGRGRLCGDVLLSMPHCWPGRRRLRDGAAGRGPELPALEEAEEEKVCRNCTQLQEMFALCEPYLSCLRR